MSQVEAYINNHPEEKRLLLFSLRSLILNHSPLIEERYSYQCPFYYYKKKPFVYIGVNKSYACKTVLGLCHGHLYSNSQGLLHGEGKVVRHIILEHKTPFPEIAIKEILNEGIIILNQIIAR